MTTYDIPALLHYFPSDFKEYSSTPEKAPHFNMKGLRYDDKYPDCPCSKDKQMQKIFQLINEIIMNVEKLGVLNARPKLLKDFSFREVRKKMQSEYLRLSEGKTESEMSPLSAVVELPTEYLLNYLSQFEDQNYKLGELLRQRKNTAFYQVDAKFRGDPYPGAIAAIDYLISRVGKTFEERRTNIVLVWGKLVTDKKNKTFTIKTKEKTSIDDFFKTVQKSEKANLLTKSYEELKKSQIPRYFMQVRYGSTYSKAKHIRVFSYFADAILFSDGSLWRDN